MKNYVIDASALIKGSVREVYTENVLALLALVPDNVALHIPEFCLVECTNILWKVVRFHRMPGDRADQAVTDLTTLPLVIHPAVAHLQGALKIGLDQELAVYDSIYIALAQPLSMLLTADDKQAKAARAYTVSLKPLEDVKPS